jgi:hypothetical protein
MDRRASLKALVCFRDKLPKYDRLVQGAVLADLLATWLAAHCVPDDRLKTILLRGKIFHDHMKIVRDLTKLNSMQISLTTFR